MSIGQSHREHPVRETARVIGEALDKVRPYLGSHAGGVELVGHWPGRSSRMGPFAPVSAVGVFGAAVYGTSGPVAPSSQSNCPDRVTSRAPSRSAPTPTPISRSSGATASCAASSKC